MDQRHQEYIDYYRSRMRKYENNPLYPNSYESEKAMYEAIASCNELSEFRGKMENGNLAVKNAIALVKDQETARQKFYEEIKEFIRKKAPDRILEVIDSMQGDIELTSTVSKIDTEVGVLIGIDLFTDQFYYDFTAMENVEVWRNAEVPDEWKNEVNKEWPEDTIKRHRELWEKTTFPNMKHWDPNYKFNFDLIWEERHRRKIPVPDEVVKRRIPQFKEINGID